VIRPPEPQHSSIATGDCFNVHPGLRQTDVKPQHGMIKAAFCFFATPTCNLKNKRSRIL
jgi:hypothetical protein